MPRTLLAVFAHPDDETFSIGATLARCHAEGVRTALFTATDGEAGRATGTPVRDRAELAQLRRRELLGACGVLGVDRIFTPGYPDGGLAALPADDLVAHIVRIIRDVRPEVVVTFGPEGAPNRHADHRAISRAATAAFFQAGIRTEHPTEGAPFRCRRLYFTSWTGGFGPAGVEGMPVTCRVDVRAHLPLKRAAFSEHQSQQHHLAEFGTTLTDVEEYSLAAGVPQPEPMTEDLFIGL